MVGKGLIASPVPICTIRPHPAAHMAGRKPWMHRTAAATLMAYRSSQSSGEASSQPRLTNAPALLTRMSAPPPASTPETNPAHSPRSARSATAPLAWPAGGRDRRTPGVAAPRPAAVHGPRGALGRQPAGDRLADPRAGAGNNRPPAGELKIQGQLLAAAGSAAACSLATAS